MEADQQDGGRLQQKLNCCEMVVKWLSTWPQHRSLQPVPFLQRKALDRLSSAQWAQASEQCLEIRHASASDLKC